MKSKKIKKDKQRRRQELNKASSHKLISKILKNNSPAPMGCLKRPEDKDPKRPKGSLATDHAEIDEILRDTWQNITNGTEKDLEEVAQNFLRKYDKHILNKPEFEIGDLTFEEFRDVVRVNAESAPGLDGWTPKDIGILSDNALKLMVKMFNKIEKGAPWPEHMHKTRAVFLSKDANDTQNPLAYRILKITTAWYRKWATARVKSLEKWIETWDHPALNAGVPGKGAADAWYNTAVFNELNITNGQDVAGGSIDIFKCFDQLNRTLLKELASKAGMPKRILETYFRFIENIETKFRVGKTLVKHTKTGAAFRKAAPSQCSWLLC